MRKFLYQVINYTYSIQECTIRNMLVEERWEQSCPRAGDFQQVPEALVQFLSTVEELRTYTRSLLKYRMKGDDSIVRIQITELCFMFFLLFQNKSIRNCFNCKKRPQNLEKPKCREISQT